MLTLNRPAQRNAIDIAMIDALNAAFDDIVGEPQWRVAVLTGAAPAFCAGLDLKAFAAPDAPRHAVTAMIQRVPQLGKPIVATVGGAAYTRGLELALGCDFIIASDIARFADTHAKIGALSGSGMGSRACPCRGRAFCSANDAELSTYRFDDRLAGRIDQRGVAGVGVAAACDRSCGRDRRA